VRPRQEESFLSPSRIAIRGRKDVRSKSVQRSKSYIIGVVMLNSNSKQKKKLNSGRSTKSAESQSVSAAEPIQITAASQVPKDVAKNGDLQMQAGDPSKPRARPTLASPIRPGEGYNSLRLLRRLTYRVPRDCQFRKHALTFIIGQLVKDDLPVPHDDEILEELGARHFELVRMIGREGATPEEVERGRAFLKEFLILVSAPDRTPAPPESEAM
jgi:hypothetical protein